MVASFCATALVLFLVANNLTKENWWSFVSHGMRRLGSILHIHAPERNDSLNAEGQTNVNVNFRDEWRKDKIKITDDSHKFSGGFQ